MTRLLPEEILLKNLQGKIPPRSRRIYMTKEQTHAFLKALTGKDFGHNTFLWRLWLKTHKYEANVWQAAVEAGRAAMEESALNNQT